MHDTFIACPQGLVKLQLFSPSAFMYFSKLIVIINHVPVDREHDAITMTMQTCNVICVCIPEYSGTPQSGLPEMQTLRLSGQTQ